MRFLFSFRSRSLASAAIVSAVFGCGFGVSNGYAQTTPSSESGNAVALPRIDVAQPARPRRQANTARDRAGASDASAPPAAAPQATTGPGNPNSTMTPPAAFAGGQVATGGQVGVLGNMSYMNTPYSTQNWTSDFIKNNQFTTLQDVLLTDPSVSFGQGGSRQGVDYIKIRGFADFAGQEATAVNGLVGVSSYYPPSPEFLERLELIKGSNAFLNGAPGAVGGSVNLVTKRATDKPVIDLTGGYGSSGQWGGAFDIGGRYGDAKQFGLRINGFYRDGSMAVDGYKAKQEGVAVGWDFRSERLRLDADLIYRNSKLNGDPYYSTLASPQLGLVPAPDPQLALQAPWTYMATNALIGMARAEFDVNENWTIAAAYGRSVSEDTFGGYCFNVIANLKGDATCYGGYANSQYDREAANVSLRGNFETGPLKHRLIFGGNYIGEEVGSQPNLPFMLPIPFNIYNPVWPAAVPEPAFGDRNKSNDYITRGSYITYTLSTLNDSISVIGGLRRTEIYQSSFDIVNGNQLSGSTASATTPSFGAVVKLAPWFAIYGNYIEALERGGVPPITAANAGQVFPALVSKQYEFGAKIDLQTVGATFARYDIDKANQYLDTLTNIYTQNGRQQNVGYEVTVFGEPIKGVRLVAGAAWIDAVQVKTDGGLYDGKKVASVPDYEYRLTGEFDVPFVPGFTLLGAIYRTGPAPYDNLNSFDVPAWTRFDAGARYVYYVDKTKMTARFKVENLTNEAYWIAGYGSGGLAQSGARRYLGSLTASF